MPFDPIHDVQSTVDMVEQLCRAHSAFPAAVRSDRLRDSSNERLALKLVRKDITTSGIEEDFGEEQDLFLVITTRQTICIETPK